MERKPNKAIIGLFTIFGISVFIIAIMVLIGDKIIRSEKDALVMYFDESIKGLIVGSPVSFRGVQIGKVSKIDLIANVKDLNFSVPVYVVLNKEQTFRINNNRKIRDKEAFLKDLITKGLKARLMTQSYLTGQLSIELEILPNTPAVFKANKLPRDIIEIPTVLSPLGELSKGLQNLPIRLTIDKINNILDTINKELPTLLSETSSTATKINSTISDNNLSKTVWNFNKTLNSISDAANAMKSFADFIERHPEALLKGKRY
ncbi:MAG TPA: MlaD family protein [Rickettsiales bacterium]|nr:MlaD family protein [Rickettsiales bacterium]